MDHTAQMPLGVTLRREKGDPATGEGQLGPIIDGSDRIRGEQFLKQRRKGCLFPAVRLSHDLLLPLTEVQCSLGKPWLCGSAI